MAEDTTWRPRVAPRGSIKVSSREVCLRSLFHLWESPPNKVVTLRNALFHCQWRWRLPNRRPLCLWLPRWRCLHLERPLMPRDISVKLFQFRFVIIVRCRGGKLFRRRKGGLRIIRIIDCDRHRIDRPWRRVTGVAVSLNSRSPCLVFTPALCAALALSWHSVATVLSRRYSRGGRWRPSWQPRRGSHTKIQSWWGLLGRRLQRRRLRDDRLSRRQCIQLAVHHHERPGGSSYLLKERSQLASRSCFRLHWRFRWCLRSLTGTLGILTRLRCIDLAYPRPWLYDHRCVERIVSCRNCRRWQVLSVLE